MLDVLTQHLENKPRLCVVAEWISTLKDEEQQAFKRIKEQSKEINTKALFSDLDNRTKLPFKMTAFRSHLRGYCTCQS